MTPCRVSASFGEHDPERPSLPASPSAVGIDSLRATSQVVLNRVNQLSSAVSSGEGDSFKNGVWASGLVGSSTDKNGAKKKNEFFAGSVGYEFFLSDNDLLGAAVSMVKGKSKSDGQVIKSDNYILSLYGLKHFDDMFVSGTVLGGFSNNNSVRSTEQGEAKAKFKGSLYGAAASAGYHIRNQQYVITPLVGLSYFAANQKGYKEKGSNVHDVKSKSSSVLNAKVAVKYSHLIEKDDMHITPSITVGLSHDLMLRSKANGGKVIVGDGDLVLKNKEKRQSLLFVTPSLDIKGDNFDVKLAYTLEKGKKFMGHIGSVKAVVKF